MSFTYSNVDGSGDVPSALEWQDRINAWPAIRAYKECVASRLGPARPVLDVGCGTGSDVVALGRGFGVDVSAAMCARTRARGGAVARADAAKLPFADAIFAGARCDRVVQHVADPVTVVRELVRVVAPGGRVVVADPDQSTLRIAIPGAPRDLVGELARRRRDDGYRNGMFVSRVPEVLQDAGCNDVALDRFGLVLTDPDDAFGLPTWPAFWGIAAPGWDECMHRARTAGGFRYEVTYCVVSARRP